MRKVKVNLVAEVGYSLSYMLIVPPNGASLLFVLVVAVKEGALTYEHVVDDDY